MLVLTQLTIFVTSHLASDRRRHRHNRLDVFKESNVTVTAVWSQRYLHHAVDWNRARHTHTHTQHWCKQRIYHHHHHNRFTAFFRDQPGEPVPEENLWTLWCKGRLTEADTPTIRLGATPSGLTSAHLHHPPFFTGWMPFLPPNQQCQSTEGKNNEYTPVKYCTTQCEEDIRLTASFFQDNLGKQAPERINRINQSGF